MSVLFEVKEGLFINPNFVSDVVTHARGDGVDLYIARGHSDVAIFLSALEWAAAKSLLVTLPARAAGCTCGRESVTDEALPALSPNEARQIEDALMADCAVKQAGWHAALLVEEETRITGRLADDPAEYEDDEEDDELEDDEEAAGPLDTDLSRLVHVVKSGDFVVLDTETTGLNGDAEICQISIIDSVGNVLLDTLVKPKNPIPYKASLIHGINDDMVKNAPSFIEIRDQIWNYLSTHDVIGYNVKYDFKMLKQSDAACNPDATFNWDNLPHECVMLAYAEYRGVWNDYFGNWRWHKLGDAAARVGYTLPSGLKAHSALPDCLMTLAVCKKLAGL